mgnify:FL=1
MNKICLKYIDMINDNYSDCIESIIIYGSNIYDGNSSDLDVCLITNNLSTKVQKKIIDSTIEFHRKNRLKLDEEVPFDNKLIYSTSDIDEALNYSPFYKNKKVVINEIKKTKKFLSSTEMKKRLLINILTTDHITIGKSTLEYEKRAYKIIIDVITKYFNLINPTVNELLDNMYKNKYTGAEGEMFLGYKKNHENKEKYLINKLTEYLNN